ncbi:hypothetical protein LOD99_6797 [Oopsacas minuta]|uniref:Uncharacterized protein n=1 Tax=Oopsacas minuta TaxID=111878 RepID=A0AAV7JKT4_9METZ|nr:hypothetical protein LOD99_6797 [Oopsacas minuta]
MANCNNIPGKFSHGSRTDSTVGRICSYNKRVPLRGRSKSVCEPGLTLREILTDAEGKINELKGQQQAITNEIINAKSEQKSLLLAVELEYQSIQKLIDQKQAQLTYSLNNSFDSYIEEAICLSVSIENQMSDLECSIENTKAPPKTSGMNALEVEDEMVSIRSELEDSVSGTSNFSQELSKVKSKRPRIAYQSRDSSFRELIDNIGWVEQELESFSVRNVIDSPNNPDKPKEVVSFSPLAVATDTGGTIYVLDDGKEGGILHVIVGNTWTELIHLFKDTRVKKQPYDICVTKDTIYVSYPEADIIAAIWKKHDEQTRLITHNTLSDIKPGLKSPHGLATLDIDNIVIADTGNNRVIVINKLHQITKVLSGSPLAPLHRPVSVGACGDDLIAVLHSDACTVHVYQMSGELKWRISGFEVRMEDDEMQPWTPARISLHRTGEFKEPELFITASYAGEQCVLRYNLQKMWLSKMGKTGKTFGQFRDLKGIEFCPEKQSILACDYGNKRIQIFNY